MPFRLPFRSPYVKQAPPESAPMQVDAMRETSKVDLHQLAPADYGGWQGIRRKEYGGGADYDYLEARRLSITPTPRMCINAIKLDVRNTDWEIVPLAKEGSTEPDDEAKQHAQEIFNWLWFRPNSNGESFADLIGKLTDDLMTHDAGVWTKLYGRTGGKKLVEICSRDGALFAKDIDTYLRLGVVQKQYIMDNTLYENLKVGYWYNWNSTPKVAYEPHEVVYTMHDPRTDIPYGTSKMSVLKSILYSFMYSEEYYYKYWDEGGNNPSIISPDLPAALGDQEYRKFRDNLKSNLSEYMKTLVGSAKTQITFLSDPKMIQWLEMREEYIRLTMALFKVPPTILGYTKDIHKATDDSQKAIYIQKGLFPILRSIEWYINTQIIADWFWKEEKERNVFAHGHEGKWANKPMDCLFRFKLYDPTGEKQQLDIDESKLKLGMATINSVLKARGDSPVEWGDINPLFLLGMQQWMQGYASGGLDAALLKKLTGVDAGIKEIQQAIQQATQPKPNEPQKPAETQAASEATMKAYARSRSEASSPRHGKNEYPDHERKIGE